MKDILIIVPSYERSQKIEPFYKAWKETTSGKSDLLFVLEENDRTLETYPRLEDAKYQIGSYGSLGKALNAGYREHPGYNYYACLNDDHLIRTVGWEEQVIDALSNGGIAYGNDLLQKENLATAAIISSDIAERLGYLSYPEFNHLYIDDWWMDIGKAINKLYYLDDVIIEHVHPGAGKGVMDEQYRRVNSGPAYTRDKAIWDKLVSSEREDIKALL